MHKKWLLLLTIFGFGFAAGWLSKKSKFEFHNKVPTFSEEQKSIIRKAYPEIALKHPSVESFYVSNVSRKDSMINIYLSPLASLQEGYDSRSGTESILLDGETRIVLNNKFEVIGQSDLVGDEADPERKR